MLQIKPYQSADKQRWDDYVDRHPRGRMYHKIAWKNIIERSFAKKGLYFYAEKEGQICGLFPLIKFHTFITGKMLISMPYVNYGGMLYDDDSVKEALLAEAENIRRQTQSAVVELRMVKEAEFPLPVRSNKVTFILDLPNDTEALMKSFKAKLRSQIRRPLKENMYAKVGSADLLNDFYYVFTRNMRDLGTPVYQKSFFETILNELAGQAKIVTVYTADHRPVAAAFIIGYKDTMEIPWASSLRQYNRFSPNMLLYWQVLSEAIASGYKKFDFGRGTRDGGTHRFKKQWGGKEIELHWYYLLAPDGQLPQVNKENPKYALAIKIWQKLPLFITQLAGPRIVRHLP